MSTLQQDSEGRRTRMGKLVRPGIEDLVPYPPGKPIEELEREFGIRNSIKLASNENPLGPSPRALAAIRERLETLHRYPDGSGYYLKSRLSEKFSLPRERILLGNGSNELIELIVRTFLEPGDEAVQAFPTFLVYEKIIKGAGCKMVSVPLTDFGLDLKGIADAVTSRTKVLFVNNPNNPTGTILKTSEINDFLKNIPEDVIVVLDEAYMEFVTDTLFADGTLFLDTHPGIIVLRTFSKLYGLAGLRIGYGFTSEKIADYINRVRQPFNANSLAQAAATAALDDEEFVNKTLKTVREGLGFLQEHLKRLGLEFLPTQTNFFLIRVPFGGKKVYESLLREGVIVRAMDSYGLPEYIRINVGLPQENERFIMALKKVLGKVLSFRD
jgi:histidinol-phosphate aminotransferase